MSHAARTKKNKEQTNKINANWYTLFQENKTTDHSLLLEVLSSKCQQHKGVRKQLKDSYTNIDMAFDNIHVISREVFSFLHHQRVHD